MYHELVPKILWLDVVEIQLVSASGMGISSESVSPVAGFLEIILGITIILFRKSVVPVYIAAVSLFFLLLYAGISRPETLIGAFNPVTTNILGLGFCYLILYSNRSENP